MQKAMFQFCKLEILFYVISDIKGEETVGTFYEKELKETNQKEFRVENRMLNGKATIVLLTIRSLKETLYK